MKKSAIYLSLLVSLFACRSGSGFMPKQRNASAAEPQVASAPTTLDNDRPTETGAGVPGYLVNCSEMTANDTQLQVGCNVATMDGKRFRAGSEIWTHYEVKIAPGTKPAIQVEKSQASDNTMWDVLFTFSGAPTPELRVAAQTSTYAFTYNEVHAESAKAETSDASAKPAPKTNQACTDGVSVEGICVVSVSSSCSDYCGQSQLQVHPMVIERFGSGSASNRDACKQVYDQLSQRQMPFSNLVVGDVTTGRGLGCHRKANGLIFFDGSPTDPAAAPFFGDSRICACK